MKRRVDALVGVVALVWVGSAAAQLPARAGDPVSGVDYPEFTLLNAVGDNQTFHVQCLPAGNDHEIECIFGEMRLSVSVTDGAAVARERTQLYQELAATITRLRRDRAALREAVARVREDARQTCARPALDPRWPAERRAVFAPGRSPAADRRVAIACEVASSCADADCVQRWDATFIDMLTATPAGDRSCEVTSRSWSVRFRPAGRSRWERVEPFGGCTVETASVLARVFDDGIAADVPGTHWHYSQVRRRTAPTQGDGLMCAALEVDRPFDADSFVPGVVLPACDSLSFMPLAHESFSADVRRPTISDYEQALIDDEAEAEFEREAATRRGR